VKHQSNIVLFRQEKFRLHQVHLTIFVIKWGITLQLPVCNKSPLHISSSIKVLFRNIKKNMPKSIVYPLELNDPMRPACNFCSKVRMLYGFKYLTSKSSCDCNNLYPFNATAFNATTLSSKESERMREREKERRGERVKTREREKEGEREEEGDVLLLHLCA